MSDNVDNRPTRAEAALILVVVMLIGMAYLGFLVWMLERDEPSSCPSGAILIEAA